MKWLKSKLCNWFHGGGHIKRDAQGRINWQCDTCGRWSTPVSRESERRMVDRDLAEYDAAQDPTP